ncbi:acyl-CoA dehydrogenase family protein [Gordonia polyisoprenivorans]|uniref:acyl-CoA dehydrogenase family protein n=1 Tax=Gordonia polyisoprenivorans TaxID=84595 RepID=UPI001AD73790|nr:acyl-CoA dehydrogenase family protein [Gordonia polyisoprenivorans]QTI70979.1 acyl-CoA dehydrogenase family protein [Gordonia polyisoprenivorans]
MRRKIFTPDHDTFRATVRAFLEKEAKPHAAQWEADGQANREVWKRAGELGLLGWEVPEEFGGLGIRDFRFNAILAEEIVASGTSGLGFAVNNDIVMPYMTDLTTDEQKARWLPGMVDGSIITAIAMSEPGAGSDLRSIRSSAVREGDDWILNGSKTFISNGQLANLVIVVCKTDPSAGHKGISLLVVEEGMDGFTRGRKLDKIGAKAADTSELFFENVRVPADNVLGELGRGFYNLMRNIPSERLGIAVHGVARAKRALEITLDYAKTREAFGTPIGSFQANRFYIAEMKAKVDVAQVFLDRCIEDLIAGELTAVDAAEAKMWITETEWEILDRCLQLHGGYGYVNEYEIARLWRDSRVQRVYGGTNEIMKDLIGRSLGL